MGCCTPSAQHRSLVPVPPAAGDASVHTSSQQYTHPVWNETFRIPIVNNEDAEIIFQVRSDQTVLGEAVVVLDELRAQPNKLTLTLEDVVCGPWRGLGVWMG